MGSRSPCLGYTLLYFSSNIFLARENTGVGLHRDTDKSSYIIKVGRLHAHPETELHVLRSSMQLLPSQIASQQ